MNQEKLTLEELAKAISQNKGLQYFTENEWKNTTVNQDMFILRLWDVYSKYSYRIQKQYKTIKSLQELVSAILEDKKIYYQDEYYNEWYPLGIDKDHALSQIEESLNQNNLRYEI